MRNTELTATTAAGARLVEMAEESAAEFGPAAADHDRDGSFAHAHLGALRSSGFLSAPVPGLLGGLGVSSSSDVLLACSRLARGDVATTIGVNMHFAVVMNVVQQWRRACAAGHDAKAQALGAALRLVVESGVVMAAAVSEPNQDLSRPATVAHRAEGGWRVSGRKSFCTMAPAADLLNVAVTARDLDGGERYAFALVPATAPGVEVHDDWDALGMRASGSHSVSFHDVAVAADAVRDGFPVGRFGAELLERYLTSGAFHAAASLGIAEAAHGHAVEAVRRSGLDGPTGAHQTMRLAENVVDLEAMRASFARSGHAIDAHHRSQLAGGPQPAAGGAGREADGAATVEVYGLVQAAKTFICDAAVRVVDRAMALSGGAGYLNRHPLARAYRDARAGAFMHPLGVNRAYDFLARTAIGLEPTPG
jgi:alkylation response protein AidB-like acyl-CoA dehydrogenase